MPRLLSYLMTYEETQEYVRWHKIHIPTVRKSVDGLNWAIAECKANDFRWVKLDDVVFIEDARIAFEFKLRFG